MDWKLVPETATEEMTARIRKGPYGYMDDERHQDLCEVGYLRGINAAPTPPDGLYRVVGGKVERVEADVATVDQLAKALCTSFYEYGSIYEQSVETVIEIRWKEWRPQARAALKALGAS